MKKQFIYLALVAMMVGAVYGASNYKVERSLPYFVTAGEPIDVTMNIYAKNISVLGVSQINPEGWAISSITCGGYKIGSNKVEWIFWAAGTPTGDMTCKYTLTPLISARGEYNFSGEYFQSSADTHIITGRSDMFVYSPSVKNVVDVINRWVRNEVTLQYVVDYINAWARGV
jgi:hypothetical protein